MPAFWTSTTLSSILRQAVAVAKHVPRASGTAAALGGRRARQAIVQIAKETFPSLTESGGHLLHGRSGPVYALEPIRLGTSSHRPLSAHARMLAAGRTIRTAARPFPRVNGARMTSNVGLGSARTFASGPSASAVQTNVPIAFRAFAALLSDDEIDRKVPRASRMRPYVPARRRRTRQSARRVSSVCSVDSGISLAQISHYFPYIHATSTTAASVPPTAESLVTPGSTTILSLPLSPSLSALLQSTTDVPYAAAEVGVAVLSSLTMGVISLQEAFSLHYWHKIGPLLARLDDLGFMGGEAKGVRHEIVLDSQGRPDILRLTFEGRSEADVMALIGGWLREEGGRVWWGIREIAEAGEVQGMELSKGERREMMEDWDQPTIPHEVIFEAPDLEPVDLVFPSLDASIYPTTSEDWPDSPDTTYSVYTPISDLDLESGYASPIGSLTASLLSQLSSVSSSDSRTWSVHPSEEDEDIESSVWRDSGSEIWTQSEEDDAEMMDVEDEVRGGMGSWAGVGDGFGLTQPW